MLRSVLRSALWPTCAANHDKEMNAPNIQLWKAEIFLGRRAQKKTDEGDALECPKHARN
jgi:hypothetical protein